MSYQEPSPVQEALNKCEAALNTLYRRIVCPVPQEKLHYHEAEAAIIHKVAAQRKNLVECDAALNAVYSSVAGCRPCVTSSYTERAEEILRIIKEERELLVMGVS